VIALGIYSQDQIMAARQADLPTWLQAHGYNLKREGRNWRVPGNAGLFVQGNHFKHFGSDIGGNSLDFLVDFLGYKFLDAVQALIHAAPAQLPIGHYMPPAAQNDFLLPQRGRNHRRVIAYLIKARGLPIDLIIELIRSKLLFQDDHGNCVFPCLDQRREPKGAIIRGTYTDVRYVAQAPGSDASYGWHWQPDRESNLVYITESPIDAMGLAVIRPFSRADHILALGGLKPSGVHRFLDDHQMVRTIVFSLDNDQPGLDAVKRWSVELHEKGCNVQICLPDAPAKDWNEMLILASDIPSAQA